MTNEYNYIIKNKFFSTIRFIVDSMIFPADN